MKANSCIRLLRAILILATAVPAVQAQNLVPNGDFESYRNSPCDTCSGLMNAGFNRWQNEAEFYHNLPSWQTFKNDSFSQNNCGYFNSDFFYPAKKCNRSFGSGGSDKQSAEDYRNYMHLDKSNKGCVALYWNFQGDKIGKSYLYNKLSQPVKKGTKYTFKVKVFTGEWSGVMPSDTFFNMVPFGMALSQQDPELYYRNASLFPASSQIQTHPSGFVSDGNLKYRLDKLPLKPHWVCSGKSEFKEHYRVFEYSFVADADYAYMTLGTFKDDKVIRNFSAYRGDIADVTLSYYIDDVSLVAEYAMPVIGEVFLCRNQPLELNSGISQPVDWISPSGIKLATADCISVADPEEGTWTAVNGTARKEFGVEVFKPAGETGPLNFSTCENVPVALKLNSKKETDIDYSWSNGSSGNELYTALGGKHVLFMSRHECRDSMVFNLATFPNPVFELVRKDSFCGPSEGRIVLHASPETFAYQWIPAGEPELQGMGYAQAQTIRVKAVDEKGCENSTDYSIRDECAAQIHIPNAFSPDANGLNEVFMARGTGFVCKKMQILNRWGQVVFESEHGWDGKLAGRNCPEGEYFYLMELQSGNALNIYKRGMVQLIR